MSKDTSVGALKRELNLVHLSKILPDKLHNQLVPFFTKEGLDLFTVYAMPDSFKDRFYCLVSTLKQFINSSDAGKKLELHPELSTEIGQLLSSLVYLCNSTSAKTGKYHNFDKQEIDKKLGR